MSQHHTWRGAVAMGRRWAEARRLGAAPVGRLPGFAQKAVEGRFAGQIDPSSASIGTMRAGGTSAKRASLATSSTWVRSSAVSACAAVGAPRQAVDPRVRPFGLPALQGAHMNAGGGAGQTQARTGMQSGIDIPGQALAIFEADHSSSSLLKIAATF